jgi:hypothetical protein
MRRRRQTVPVSSNLRPVSNQHTVTKRILKEYADSHGKLAVFDRTAGTRQLRSPGAGIFTTQFDLFDSRGAEERWNIFENRFPAALSRVRLRTALTDDRTVATLKDLIALHWARSTSIRVTQERIYAKVIEEHKRRLVKTRPDLLERALRNDVGLTAASHAELNWLSDKLHDRVATENTAMWNSQRDAVNFAAARSYIDKFAVQVGYAEGRDFLISDCPVLTTTQGVKGTGPHQGIGIKSANRIAMPIAPDLLLALGPEPAIHEMTNEVVDRYNQWQWEACVSWIAARPGGAADTTLVLAERLAAQS